MGTCTYLLGKTHFTDGLIYRIPWGFLGANICRLNYDILIFRFDFCC